LSENGPKAIKEDDSCVRMRVNNHSRHRTKNVTSKHLITNLMILYLEVNCISNFKTRELFSMIRSESSKIEVSEGANVKVETN